MLIQGGPSIDPIRNHIKLPYTRLIFIGQAHNRSYQVTNLPKSSFYRLWRDISSKSIEEISYLLGHTLPGVVTVGIGFPFNIYYLIEL